MPMNPREMRLAADLLAQASDRYANDGSNDWQFPADWTVEQRREFVQAYHEWNGDPGEYRPDFLVLPNFAVMGFLAHRLRQESGGER